MSNPDPLSAAGGTITLGGNTYLLSKTRVAMLKHYEAWLRQQLEMLPRRFDVMLVKVQGLSEALQQRYLDQALQADEDARKLDSPEARRLANGAESTALLLWLHLRPSHPEITLQRVTEWLDAEEIDLERLQDQLDRLQGLDREPEGNSPNPRGQEQPIPPPPGAVVTVTSPVVTAGVPIPSIS